MIKRFTLALFALVTCVIGASADTVTVNGTTFYYTTNTDGTNTVTITNSSEGTTTAKTNSYTSSSVTVPNTFTNSGTTYTVTQIGAYAFQACKSMTSVNLSNCKSLTTIGAQAFYNCTVLTSVTLPSTLTSIGNFAFNNCWVLAGTITLPSTLTTLGNGAFRYCYKITSVDLSACTSLTSLSANTFYDCTKLASIELPDSLTTINAHAFYNCTSLDSIALPENLTTIGHGAFYGCTALATIKCKATSVPAAITTTTTTDSTFYNCSALSKVYVRPYLLASYQSFETTGSHTVWDGLDDGVFYPYYDLTVGDAGAATLCLPFTSTIPDDVTLYTLDLVQKSSTDSSQYVAGGTDITDDADTLTYDRPVYVTAEAGTYEFLGYYGGSDSNYHLSETTATATEGVLTGVYQATTADAGVYVLQDQGSGAKFYPVKSGSNITIGQFRAYLTYGEDSSAKSISFGFNDDDADADNQTTDISGVSVAETSLGVVYTLQGVRVSEDNLQRGIYIRDGKKFVVK